MRTMTSKEMTEANGGKYRYYCTKCDSRFRTWVGALGHAITHPGHKEFYRV